MSTGFPSSDAQSDFARARRARVLSDIARRLRREPGDVGQILPFEEVVDALGRVGQVDRGLQVVQLDDIVGTVDRAADFDRGFRPTTVRLRSRWERIAAAQRRGEAMPPVSLFQIGELYFVRDGHHRVSVAKSQGRKDIDAYVTEVVTAMPAPSDLTIADLPRKSGQRVFFERVPLPEEVRDAIRLREPDDYFQLAEGVEAWAFRYMMERGELISRREAAGLWWTEEYEPAVRILRDEDLIADLAEDDAGLTETEAYLRFSAQRYRLLRSHRWDDHAIDAVRQTPPVSLTRRSHRR